MAWCLCAGRSSCRGSGSRSLDGRWRPAPRPGGCRGRTAAWSAFARRRRDGGGSPAPHPRRRRRGRARWQRCCTETLLASCRRSARCPGSQLAGNIRRHPAGAFRDPPRSATIRSCAPWESARHGAGARGQDGEDHHFALAADHQGVPALEAMRATTSAAVDVVLRRGRGIMVEPPRVLALSGLNQGAHVGRRNRDGPTSHAKCRRRTACRWVNTVRMNHFVRGVANHGLNVRSRRSRSSVLNVSSTWLIGIVVAWTWRYLSAFTRQQSPQDSPVGGRASAPRSAPRSSRTCREPLRPVESTPSR